MLVYFAILLIGLMGFSGLVVDVGRIELRSLQLQAAADSAALSAAAEYQRTSNMTTATSAANAELATFASLNGVAAPTATVTLSATSGHYQNDGSTLQVKVTQPISTTMLSLIKGSGSTLNAGAIAVAMIPPCIYLMGNPSFNSGGSLYNLWLASQGFHLTCPMYSTQGYIVDGFSNINSWQAKASVSTPVTGGGWTSPAVILNSPALSDPLAYVVSPSFSSCDHPSTTNYPTGSNTMTPGTYCGGINISGASTTVTMQPGLYIVTGQVNITGGATVTGTGVTMFLTKGGGSGFGGFSMNGGSKFNVSAPIDNSNNGIPAILLMTDRAWSHGNQDISLNGSTISGDGILYITGTGIFSWNNYLHGSRYFGFVTANLYMFATNLVFSSDYSQLPGGNPFRTVISLVQ